MEQQKRVSVVLPTYNRGHLLDRCINSLLSQTYSEWELVILDDCSADGTWEIVRSFVLGDGRIRYHRNASRQGLPKTRNISLSLISGDLVFFIEDDMVLDCRCLEILVRTYRSLSEDGMPIGAVCPSLVNHINYAATQRRLLDTARSASESKAAGTPYYVDKMTGLTHRNYSPEFKGLFEVGDCHACSLYPRSIFSGGMRYEEKAYTGNYIGEEADFHFKLRRAGYKLMFQPEAVLNHYVTGSGGCRLPLFQWSYYFARNHVTFLVRNYRLRSAYMVPLFFGYCVSILLRYALGKRTGSPTPSI